MSKILVLDKTICLVQEYLKACSVDGKMEEPKSNFESEFTEAVEELKELCDIKSIVLKDTLPVRSTVCTSETSELTKLDLLEEQLEMLRHNLVCYSSDLSLTYPKVGFERSYEETRNRMELLLEVCTIVEAHDASYQPLSIEEETDVK